MTTALAVKRKWTSAEYLSLERASAEKHEYINGEIFAMAGCSLKHDRVATSLLAAFSNRLRGSRCEPHSSDVRIHIPATGKYTYSDGFIICGPEFTDDSLDTVTNPCVIAEVLSSSTEGYDRGAKFEAYKSIPALRDYLLFSQDRIFLEHFYRQADGAWVRCEVRVGQVLQLRAIALMIPVEDLYPWGFDR